MRKGEYYKAKSSGEIYMSFVKIIEVLKDQVIYMRIGATRIPGLLQSSKSAFKERFEKISLMKIKIPALCHVEIYLNIGSKRKINHIPNKQWLKLLKEKPEMVMLYDSATSKVIYVLVKSIIKKRQLNEDIIVLEWKMAWGCGTKI